MLSKGNTHCIQIYTKATSSFSLEAYWWECVDLQGGEGQSTKTNQTTAQSC